MMHANGISYEGDILDLAMTGKACHPYRHLVPLRRYATWSRPGKAREFLRENPKLTEELREKILTSGELAAAGSVVSAADVENVVE